MNRLDRIQRISGLLRYLLLGAAALLCAAIALALLVPGQEWITLGDGQLNDLRKSGSIGLGGMLVATAPMTIVLALGIYWLQRLFGEYQLGRFFTDSTMRCYLWLVWLKAGGFVYGMFLPLLLPAVSSDSGTSDVSLTLEPGALVELIVLLLIVYVLKEAQKIHDENQAFV